MVRNRSMLSVRHRLSRTSHVGITFLRGRTNYGDSIEDEWVVVYLLRELTRKHKDLWVKVVDSDGEFLLIEAAGSLPSWLEPEVADNRVGSDWLLLDEC